MNAADVAEAMAEAGCSGELIAATLRALRRKRSSAAVRQARYRAKKAAAAGDATLHHVTSRDACYVTSLPKKERVPPTPPLLEKTPSLFSEADASLVDEGVDVSPSKLEKPKKNLEELRVFGESWNRLAVTFNLAPIDEIKPGSMRERHALARLREMPADGLERLMARIRGSPWLRGELNEFRASFDWIIKAANYQKIMEGNYEDRKITAFRRS